MLSFLAFALLIVTSYALPQNRLRRDAEQEQSCKNTYDQCPEWKQQGMCTMSQYTDYMRTVCPVTCEFCKGMNHVRDEIEEPEFIANNVDLSEDEAEDEGSGNSNIAEEQSGNNAESGESESANEPVEKAPVSVNKSEGNASTKTNINMKPAEDKRVTVTKEEGDLSNDQASGDSETGENEVPDEEEETDEQGSTRDEEGKPIQLPGSLTKGEKYPSNNTEEEMEGKITVSLRQNYTPMLAQKDSASYQMLSGNVKKDFEKVLKGATIKDIKFSEADIDGNPRQVGKTKVHFNLESADHHVMKKLTKLVSSGNINGLSVVSGTLEFEE